MNSQLLVNMFFFFVNSFFFVRKNIKSWMLTCFIQILGTFVDPRIIPGFYYRVRPAGSRRHLFEGRSLLLQSVGMGYGKRITFKPDTLNAPENYFWSDSHPEGIGMETRAIHPGMKFTVSGNGVSKKHKHHRL